MASRGEAPLFARRETPPPLWDADLVGKRLVQAFVTLDRLPRLRGPRVPGGHWPRTVTEWADQLAQAELEESERRTRSEAANRTVIRPSAAEITHMETAFAWLSELRVEDFRHGACRDPLGVARRARKIDQEAIPLAVSSSCKPCDSLGAELGANLDDNNVAVSLLRRKAMGAAYFFSQARQGLGAFGAGPQRARGAGFLGATSIRFARHPAPLARGRTSSPHRLEGARLDERGKSRSDRREARGI